MIRQITTGSACWSVSGFSSASSCTLGEYKLSLHGVVKSKRNATFELNVAQFQVELQDP
jgi:hypothetical protein